MRILHRPSRRENGGGTGGDGGNRPVAVDRGMDIVAYKLVFIAVILVVGLVAGLLPVLAGAQARYERLFSLGNALGGGVFLGAGLIHLLPDAIDNYADLLGPGLDYPLASLICAAGFLMVLLIEKVIVRGDEDRFAEAAGQNAMAPYVLALVLSVHSIIAGIALGTERHLATSVALFLAVVAHKGVASFALGARLRRGGIERGKSVGLIALFSSMTPLGIAAGSIVGALLTDRGAQWFEGIFDALAAGTFLYIAVVDIVEDEFSRGKDIELKFLMVLLGLAIMALVAIWT